MAPDKDADSKAKGSGWPDVARDVIGHLAHFADRNTAALLAFTMAILLVAIVRWPSEQLPKTASLLVEALTSNVVTVFLISWLLLQWGAFKVMRSVYRRRLGEMAERIRRLEEHILPGRLSSRDPIDDSPRALSTGKRSDASTKELA